MKRFLILLFFTVLGFSASAQIRGGAGICHVQGDPNLISGTETQDIRDECFFAIDTTNDTRLWYYKYDETLGNRWQEVPLAAMTDTDTRLDNPRIVGSLLRFNVINVLTTGVLDSVDVDLAAFQDSYTFIEGTGIDIVVSNDTVTITNTLPNVTTDLSFSGTGPITLNSSDGTDVTFTEGAGIDLSGNSSNTTIAIRAVEADNMADAATEGVAVGDYFYASLTNTMGMVPGTLVRRMY